MRKLTALHFSAFALLISAPLQAQRDVGTRVDIMLRSEMGKRVIPGLSVVVVSDGKVVKKSTYGVASVELETPATNATLFQIASATKNVTGVAAMQLVEAGKLHLDDRVVDVLPGLPDAWRPVTVRQILSHTSGLPDMILDPMTGVWLPGSTDSVIKQLSKMPIKAPGTEWSYNQTNYMLLGLIIEKLGGLPYREYFRQRILAPLGINDVVFGDSRTVAKGRTSEYTRFDVKGTPKQLTDLHAFSYQYPDQLYTAAGIFMNADDMGRWLEGITKGATLSAESFATMTTPITLNDGKRASLGDPTVGYGLGWITMERAEHRAVGGSGGGRTALFYYPSDRLAVAIMTNLQGAGPEELVERVAAEYRDRK